MTTPLVKYANSHPAEIFIAGDYDEARKIVRKFCDEVGCCVTVTPITYIYTQGEETGIRVGFINYPRFPKTPDEIESQAQLLAERLLRALGQQSYSIQSPDETMWVSYRDQDVSEI